ncbi:MAG: signal peptidase I [Lachnospiraceae bacterium]|jgi:signal peptidase I|nr:signal peptidase I [Lachnospiraceae bacterium]
MIEKKREASAIEKLKTENGSIESPYIDGIESEDSSIDLPDTKELETELRRTRHHTHRKNTWKETLFTLFAVAAAAILAATLFLPVLRIEGSSMTPTLWEGNVVISLQGAEFKEGDIIAFYYNNKILVKRVIARAGDWVDIRDDGTVFVNDEELEEPYVAEKALGECNIKLPYQVPDKKFFLMGDHRSVSIDSRSTSVGCVAEEQIVGKLVFCIWPLKDFRAIQHSGE